MSENQVWRHSWQERYRAAVGGAIRCNVQLRKTHWWQWRRRAELRDKMDSYLRSAALCPLNALT